MIAKGFKNNYDKFNSFNEYFEEYKERKKQEEKVKNGGLKKFINKRLDTNDSLYSIRGEKCKSLGEVKIANFLFVNGIDYEYEKIFDEKVDEDRTYCPDFTIKYLGKKIYIEYFGLSYYYNNTNMSQEKARRKYNLIRRKKENFQKMHTNYDFINLDNNFIEKDFIKKLKEELIKRNVVIGQKSDDEIFDDIKNTNRTAEFYPFVDFCLDFISLLKNMLLDDMINDIVNKIYNNNPNDKILLLARNNGPIEDLVKGKFFKKGINDIVICNQVPKANIEAITIHSSKGLTANQVIVFGLKEKLFPSKGKAKNWVYNYFKLDTIDEWIKKYKEEIDISVDRKEEDFIDNPEERRLFYVAITRTKNKVYLVVPEKAVDRTPYVDEVENIQDEYEKNIEKKV